MPLYQHIKKNGGWDNFDMVLIDTRSCENILHACKFERGYVEQLKATLKSKRPVGSTEEKKEHDRLYALGDCKHYYNNNKETILLTKKEYYENNKDKLALQARERNRRNRAELNLID